MPPTEKKNPPARVTIFHQLLDLNVAEGHVVSSVDALVEEAFGIAAAASETTGNFLTIATYSALSNEISSQLTAELNETLVPSQTLDFITPEKLLYLVGLVKVLHNP